MTLYVTLYVILYVTLCVILCVMWNVCALLSLITTNLSNLITTKYKPALI